MSSATLFGDRGWNSIHHSEADEIKPKARDGSMGEYSDEESDDADSLMQSPPLLTPNDIQRALHPLQATADRVGKQVELFAESLDRLTQNQPSPQADCRHILPLVFKYQRIAHDTVEQLKHAHTHEKQPQMTRAWKRKLRDHSGESTPTSQHVEGDSEASPHFALEQFKHWESEEHTWDLLGHMLQVEYPISQPGAQTAELNREFSRPARGTEIHRYSSEQDIWNNFLAEDNLAWERHTVVEWLKRCADTSGQDIDTVVRELDHEADRGTGLWAHSWLYSKEAIKAQKRLRSWPQPLEPDAPGIDSSLLIADRSRGLITQLDPDAITRQERSPEKQDSYFEKATWLACWEMLRRGKSWDQICEWCQLRVESWRAIAMRGDPRYSNADSESSTHLAGNWQSRALWRKVCAIAAKNGGVDKYENAVYGALSGYLPSVKNVCTSWDDYLFAHYNSYLLRQFDRYIKSNFPDRIPSSVAEKNGSFKFSAGAGQRAQSGNQIIQKMKTLVRTGKEAREPFKALQGSLIAKAFDHFVVSQGVHLARCANKHAKSKILPLVKPDQPEDNALANITVDDYSLLRIVTHILFVFQDLGLDFAEDDERKAAENFVVAYVDYLGKAGKQQLLPLYASRLSSKRAVSCLGRQLPFIRDHSERKTFMRLMKQCKIDVPGVLNMQLQLIIADSSPQGPNSFSCPRLKLLMPNKDPQSFVYPIQDNFIGDSITDDEQDLIHGFEWYLLLEGHWQQTMTTGAILYKHFLRTQSLAAARGLLYTVNFSNISLRKTPGILGRAIDLGTKLDGSDEEGESNYLNATTSRHRHGSYNRRRIPSRRGSFGDRRLLLEQSRTFRDFEALFAVLDAIEQWKGVVHEIDSRPDQRSIDKRLKDELRDAYTKVEMLIQPLLHGWLQHPKDDNEATEFRHIREACLPEVVLAYSIILNHSGYHVSRDCFLKCMDLAASVAAEGSDLAPCFVAAGRMADLVDSFALTSRSMIQAVERGTGGKTRKVDGANLDLWITKPPTTVN